MSNESKNRFGEFELRSTANLHIHEMLTLSAFPQFQACRVRHGDADDAPAPLWRIAEKRFGRGLVVQRATLL
jgi:hypothetical protein